MNRLLLFFSVFCLINLASFAQQSTVFYLLEVNETHTPAFRDDNGNIHLYYTIHGMTTTEEINAFTSGIYHFGRVVENEVVNTAPGNVTFHTVVYPETNASVLRKMFYFQNVFQMSIFGESILTTELTDEIIQKYIQL